MKNTIFIASALAVGIPMFFGNLWLIAVAVFIVEAAVVPIVDTLINSIGPD